MNNKDQRDVLPILGEDNFKIIDTRMNIDFLVKKNDTEIRMYFDYKRNVPDKTAVTDVVNELIYNGDCIGADLDRLLYGEVKVFFNPIYQDYKGQNHVIKKLKESIKKEDSESTL